MATTIPYISERECRERNGWLYWWKRWLKRVRCGAIYGHAYKRVTPEVQGMIGCECVHCGKFKVF